MELDPTESWKKKKGNCPLWRMNSESSRFRCTWEFLQIESLSLGLRPCRYRVPASHHSLTPWSHPRTADGSVSNMQSILPWRQLQDDQPKEPPSECMTLSLSRRLLMTTHWHWGGTVAFQTSSVVLFLYEAYIPSLWLWTERVWDGLDSQDPRHLGQDVTSQDLRDLLLLLLFSNIMTLSRKNFFVFCKNLAKAILWPQFSLWPIQILFVKTYF